MTLWISNGEPNDLPPPCHGIRRRRQLSGAALAQHASGTLLTQEMEGGITNGDLIGISWDFILVDLIGYDNDYNPTYINYPTYIQYDMMYDISWIFLYPLFWETSMSWTWVVSPWEKKKHLSPRI